MSKIPKGTVWISAELKGSCYEEERYCNSFSPNENDNDIGDNQEEND